MRKRSRKKNLELSLLSVIADVQNKPLSLKQSQALFTLYSHPSFWSPDPRWNRLRRWLRKRLDFSLVKRSFNRWTRETFP